MAEQTSNQSTARSDAKSRSRWLGKVGIGLLIALGVGVVGLFCTSTFGAVAGVEFSPDDFTRRRFHYYELPIVHLKVTPIYRDICTGDLERRLTRKRFIAKRRVKRDQKQWDLVSLDRGMVRVDERDSAILCGYLDLRNGEDDLVWLKWTDANPALAKVLWPAVADAARRELYMITPDLIELSKGAADPQQFDRDLKRLLADKYRQFGEAQQALERHEAAVRLFTASLKQAPGDAKTLAARATSYDALQKPDLAAKDRAALKAEAP